MDEALVERQRRGVRRTVLIVLVCIAVAIAGFVNRMTHARVLTEAEMHANGAVLLKTPRTPSPFVLTDMHGKPFTNDSLKGHWTLLFFGYTSCPDVCPTTLHMLGQWYREIRDTRYGKDLQIVMVTVDPARDTPAVLNQYVSYFHPEFNGVTGDFMVLQRFAREMNIAFQKVPGGSEGQYLVDHSSQLVLINPYGDYHAFFRPSDLSGPVPAFNAHQLTLTYKSILTQW